MKVKIKKLTDCAVIPKYAKSGDAGMDLVATSSLLEKTDSGEYIVSYGTGLAFEIPDGHVGLIYPRSSIYKTNLILSNHVGVVDSKYRGEVMFKFRLSNNDLTKMYSVGDRVGQIIIMPYPTIEFVESEALSETDRGNGGFGSTGK